MGFGPGKYAHIWKLENKGNYHVAEMSTSKKNKETEQYETDWTNKFVRLVGTAHQQVEKLDITKNVKIGACEVTNKYVKEKDTTYTNYVIFGFEEDENRQKNDSKLKTDSDDFLSIPEEDNELPF